MRLPARTLAFLLGAGLTGLLAGSDSYLMFRDQRAQYQRDAQVILQYQADLLAERLRIRRDTWRELLTILGALDVLRSDNADDSTLRGVLADFVGANAELLWLGLLDAEGQVVAASDSFAAPPELPAMAALIRGGGVEVAYGGPRQTPAGLVVHLAMAMTPTRMLAAQMSLDWAERLRASQEKQSLFGAQLAILGPAGDVMLPSQPRALSGPVLEASSRIGRSDETVRASVMAQAVVERLRPFALRLGIGSLATSLAVGALLALLAHRSQRALAESRSRAEHDPLTGLRNRAGFAVWQASAAGSRVAVVALDLDGFKPINDLHGHAVGDEVLRGVAQAMQARLRPGDAAVRLGGDEFLFALLPRGNEDGGVSAEAVAWRLIRVLAEGVETSAGSLPVGASAGIALVPEDAPSFSAALALADEALYAAKRAGKGTVLRASPKPPPGA